MRRRRSWVRAPWRRRLRSALRRTELTADQKIFSNAPSDGSTLLCRSWQVTPPADASHECVRAVRARAGTNNCTDDGDPRRLHNQSAPFDRRGGRINSADVRAHISRNGRFGGERVTHQLIRRGTEQARTPEVSPPVDDTTSHHLIYSKL